MTNEDDELAQFRIWRTKKSFMLRELASIQSVVQRRRSYLGVVESEVNRAEEKLGWLNQQIQKLEKEKA